YLYLYKSIMQRISTLLQKLTELSEQDAQPTVIDIDLMLDYTRVLYADLLELRKNAQLVTVTEPVTDTAPLPPPPIPDVQEETVSLPPEIKYADVPVIDIRTHIGINDKYLFINELFSGDKAAYDDAIKHLNT